MLTKSGDFRSLLESGDRHVFEHFFFFWKKGGGKLGIVISRKVGGAVTRNRIRRLLKESYRLIQPDFQNVNVVVVVRKSSRGITFMRCTKDWGVFRDEIGKTS